MECDHEDHQWRPIRFVIIDPKGLVFLKDSHIKLSVCLKCGILRVPPEQIEKLERIINADPA